MGGSRMGVIGPVVLLLFSLGCTPAGEGPSAGEKGTIRVISAAIQCNEPGKNAKALWITGEEAYGKIHRRLSAHRPGKAPRFQPLDFHRFGVLAVFMGFRPTAGYGLTLAAAKPEMRDGALEVRLEWREPAPGRLQAQMTTSPCILLEVPRGEFARIRIVDQAGELRIALKTGPA